MERVYDFMKRQYISGDYRASTFFKEYNIPSEKNTPILGDFE